MGSNHEKMQVESLVTHSLSAVLQPLFIFAKTSKCNLLNLQFQPQEIYCFKILKLMLLGKSKYFILPDCSFKVSEKPSKCTAGVRVCYANTFFVVDKLHGMPFQKSVTFFSLLSPGFADAESNQSLNLFCFLEQSFCLNKKKALLTFSSCKYSKNECSDISGRKACRLFLYTSSLEKKNAMKNEKKICHTS